MLTKQELEQIGQVVETKVRSEVTAAETRMMSQLKASEERMTERMDHGFGKVFSDIRDVIDNQHVIMDHADRRLTNHEKRLDRLEKVTHLTQNS